MTPGGAFPDGDQIIKVLQKIANFWTSLPQQKEGLREVISNHDLADIAMKNYPDTRVAFACKLMCTCLVNFYALNVANHDNWRKLMYQLSTEDWRTVQEMEAIASTLANYAVNEAQVSGRILSSLKPYYRMALVSVSEKKKFEVLSVKITPRDWTLHDIPWTLRRVDAFTDAGRKLPSLPQEAN